MSTAEERMRILRMIEEESITPEEGAELFRALSSRADSAGPRREPRWLRVRITDLSNNQTKVSINLPMSLVRTGIRLGARFVPTEAGFDYDEVMDAINNGESGKIVDYVDQDSQERVEVWAE